MMVQQPQGQMPVQYVQPGLQGQPVPVVYSVVPMQQQPAPAYIQQPQPVYVVQQQQQEQAAVKIQAAWKGKQVRSNMDQFMYGN